MPGDPDESRIIQQVLRHRLPGGGAGPAHPAAEPGDDAAVVADGVVVTVDTMVQGVHWDARLDPADVGWKLAAVNASDVGAMGCRPTWAVLALSLPDPPDHAWVDAFARGLAEGLARYGARLVGGDTTRSPGPIVASLTMGGQGAAPVARSGGRPGDELWVSGAPGEAAAGFFEGHPAGLRHLRRPDPPVELGAALGEQRLARAMMDLSDGLLRDLPRLCAACGTGATVHAAALPLGPAAAASPPGVRLARQVSFGDDYELLFAADPADRPAVLALAARLGRAVHPIGHLTSDPEIRLLGAAWPAPAFVHFTATPGGA